MGKNDAIVSFENVSKVYHKGMVLPPFGVMIKGLMGGGRRFWRTFAEQRAFYALKDVSFEARKGEVLGIIGPNGAGKSTILKILANITDYTSGQVNINGRVGALIEVGAGFHPELTGRDNIIHYGAILGMKRKEIISKIDEIIEFSGINPEFIDTPVKKYSSGMYVRLAFSVAINISPDVLLVDEVLAVGDSEFQRKCQSRIARLCDEAKVIVFVSHSMGLIQRMCQKVMVIDQGQCVFLGEPDDAITKYEEISVRHGVKGDEVTYSNRQGSGEIRFDRVEIIGPDGKITDSVTSGEAMELALHIKVNTPIERPNISLRILDVNLVEVMRVEARQYLDGQIIDKDFMVRFNLKYLPCLPGPHYFQFKASTTHMLESVPVAQSFTILRPENLKVMPPKGGCYVDYDVK